MKHQQRRNDMTTQYTPGPWNWDGNPCNYDATNEAPWLICAQGKYHPVLGGTITCTNEANARLIAASPELLEFAEEVRRTGDTRLASMAIALIAKATGAA
jgi:hypothetical protein